MSCAAGAARNSCCCSRTARTWKPLRADRIRTAVKNQDITFGRDCINITLSCGVAQHRMGESLESVTGRADAALYAAKHAGRDQVRVAP